MNINNGFNVLPWYDSLEKQNSKKWYAYGQAWPLLCPQGFILPFQFICDSAITITSTIHAVNTQTGASVNLGVTPTVTEITRADVTYYLVKLNSVAVTSLPIGHYNLRMNTSVGYLYSEEITIINNASECIKLEYWNEDTLRFTSGEINFDDNFHFILYINSTIGKPEYEFEEELTKRLGYKFIESQTSNKLYKFAFAAPEYICDALRLVRMCDYIKLTTKYDSYNALSFAYEPKWQEQGDLAAVDVEFDTDCIIQKLESFNRRVKESFYNALLADIDEPVLFSTDTVAQYYTEYTSVSSINGKLIRQLNAISPLELQDNLDSLVLALDNQADSKQEAKKVFLSDILGLIDSVSKLFKGHYDEAGNLLWIEALSHIGINGGLTMFIEDGEISLPSLYDGLPIDNSTLVWKDGVLMLNPNIKLSGASSWSELEGKPSWVTDTKPKYSYSEIEGTPDLSVFVTDTALRNTLADYATLTYLTGELKKYVTLDGAQDIKGVKNFVNGLKVSGMPITKLQDDVIYIDANLVVRGGVTMYSTNEADIPTIKDEIGFAGYNGSIGLASFDSTQFVISANGTVSVKGGSTGLDTAQLKDYLDSNKYTTETWVKAQGYASASSLSSLQTKVNNFLEGSDTDTIINKWKELEAFLSGLSESDNLATILSTKWTTDNSLINKWNTAYGWGDHASVGYALKSYVDNNFVTLGTKQTITGEKNFTGGLFVNGKQIQYIPTDNGGYWKLEGDLLVTGGVTMYGEDEGDLPSIIDSLPIASTSSAGIASFDSTYFSVNASGKVTLTSAPSMVSILGSLQDVSSSVSGTTNSDVVLFKSANTSTWTTKLLSEIGSGGSISRPLRWTGYDNGMWDGTSDGLIIIPTSLKNPNALTFTGAVSATYDGSSAVTVNVPTAGGDIDLSNYLPLTGGTINGNLIVNGEFITNQQILPVTPVSLGNANYPWGTLYANAGYIAGNTILHSGNYSSYALPLSGGTLTGALYLGMYGNTTYTTGLISVNSDGLIISSIWEDFSKLLRRPITLTWRGGYADYGGLRITGYSDAELGGKPILHSGNYSSYALPLSGGTIYSSNGAVPLFINSTYANQSGMIFRYSNADKSQVGWQKDHGTRLYDYGSSSYISIKDGVFKFNTDTILHSGNISSYNAGSATKLQTPRTIWGQSFDGTANVSGNIKGSYFTIGDTDKAYIELLAGSYLGYVQMSSDGSIAIGPNLSSSVIVTQAGKTGMGTTNPYSKLEVKGCIYANNGSTSMPSFRWNKSGTYWGGIGYNGIDNYNEFGSCNNDTWVNADVDTWRFRGNIISTGGITMYSDIRKKTKLQDVELSLSQIANAPLIQHYYNSDQEKTTHVGSIAQYWYDMNDWFCKEDSEGYLTMEIQNCALASAISIARELDRYETKTDKTIRKMKQRIAELEEEVERLKQN